MHSPFGLIAIFLTLSLGIGGGDSARANESVSSCGTGGADTTPEFDWMEDLSRSIAASTEDPPPPKKPEKKVAEKKPSPKVPVPKVPETKEEEEDDPEPKSSRYDLPADELKKLRDAGYRAAAVRRKGIKNIHKSKYMCYRGVKEALADAGMVDSWWAEEAAVNAHRHKSLEKRGFKNVIEEGYNSWNAPLGAVLVFSGGKYRCSDDRGRARKLQCGHIEIKVGDKDYCSDFCTNHPVDSKIDRKLVGVYVKE